MAIAVDAAMVRQLLGPLQGLWPDDAQLTGDIVAAPALAAMRTLCPTVGMIVDPEGERVANVALANLVAAELLRDMPEFSSTAIGDTRLSYTADAWNSRRMRMVARAKGMMSTVCPASRVNVSGVFTTAPGGRAT